METKYFQYANPKNEKGKFQEIPIGLLVIPASDDESCKLQEKDLFQRKEYSGNKIKADKWDWAMCGALIVAKKGNSYLVVDGGNRLRAARENGKIDTMPCMVFDNLNITDMSKVFVGVQENRRAVEASQKHKAKVICKDPIALAVEEIITKYGYCVPCGGNKKEFVFDSVSTLYSLVKYDSKIAERAFYVCSEIAQGDKIYKEMLCGVFELEWRSILQKGHTIFTEGNIEKLASQSVSVIRREINRLSAECGQNNRKIQSRAILDLINKGRSSGKIRINFE